jgi:hypothetical protein
MLLVQSSFLGAFGLRFRSLLPRLLDWPAAALALEDVHYLSQIFGRGSVRTMQPQLSAFYFRPDAPLHLHDSKETRLAALLQRFRRLAQRLVGIKVQNRNPFRLRSLLRSRPLLDRKKAVWHA